MSTCPTPSTAPPAVDEGLSHIVCCKNENLALCGIDATGAELDEDADTSCIVCQDLHRSYWFCPRGGKCDGGVS